MMKQLPKEYTRTTNLLMGDERFERYLRAFEEPAPVSIRLNPLKTESEERGARYEVRGEPVPWCRGAFYLPSRPNFTMDPLFHAGCYYVQEAASMFLDEALRQAEANFSLFTFPSSVHQALDLCAAPGGKSTLLRSALPTHCLLYSNEPVWNRASILLENVTKWAYTNHFVTNLYPRDYRKSGMMFDLILCDVPCSGEGMFRKDEATIREWSPQNVEKCWKLQREIVSDAWTCLRPGGLLIYSTCTFNTKENEENICWMLSEYEDAEAVRIETKADWNITGSLLEGFTEPVYRFIPGITRSEGLFMCVLHKKGESTSCSDKAGRKQPRKPQLPLLTPPVLNQDGEDLPKVELTYAQAMAYLRHEALTLSPDTPRGIVEVCFEEHALGLAKNIGNRANNLYPKEWKIKTTYIPNEHETILRHT